MFLVTQANRLVTLPDYRLKDTIVQDSILNDSNLYLENLMTGFVGRGRELDRLEQHLTWVREAKGDLPGRALLLRGRCRVGKSRLIEVFCERSGVPYFIFQATRKEPADRERAQFVEQVRNSSLPGRDAFDNVTLSSWNAVLRQLALALPENSPSIVVLDELPWLLEQDSAAEGALQTAWDRALSKLPVLFILIGSDLAMMERLTDYERPFYQRGVEMTLLPLSPREVAGMLRLSAADAFDAFLLTGGLPLICQEWEPGWTPHQFLQHALSDPTSALLVSGERALAAEFPFAAQARRVLAAIGAGERVFSSIGQRAGGQEPLQPGSLNSALTVLRDKRVVAVDVPLSIRPAPKQRRYRVADPYLRFWLSFLARGISEVERGRGDLVLQSIERSWSSWRGRAIEPVVRDALGRLLPNNTWPGARSIGGWWNRQNNPEVDLVAADSEPTASSIAFAGSIKWLERQPFGARDFAALARDAAVVPGVTERTPLVAVSWAGVSIDSLAASWGPDDLLRAWEQPAG